MMLSDVLSQKSLPIKTAFLSQWIMRDAQVIWSSYPREIKSRYASFEQHQRGVKFATTLDSRQIRPHSTVPIAA